MNETVNLHLPQFAETDRIHHDDFNDAFAKIDTAVKTNSTAITALDSAKASTADLTAETQAREQAVSTEAAARQNADTALQNNIDAEAAARAAALAAVNANLGSHGHNLRIAIGSYTGDGKSGSAWPTSLTFDFTPVMVFLYSESGNKLGNGWMMRPLTRGCAPSQVGNDSKEVTTVSWDDHTVRWYSASTEDQAYYQGSVNRFVYRYLALGYDD